MPDSSFDLGLHAFTLPLVIAAIQEVGPPFAIAAVPSEEQQGPLLVTLATELACVLVGLLHEHLAWGKCLAEADRNFEAKGGKDYLQAKQKVQFLRDQEQKIITDARRIERQLLRVAAGEIVDRAGGDDASHSPDGGFLRWTENPASTPERRSRYETLFHDCVILRKQIKDAEADMAKLENRKPKKEKEQAPINIDFNAPYADLQGGAAALLLQTDRRWWSRFARHIEKSIARTFPNRGALAMLRDPALNRAVGVETSFQKFNPNSAWTFLLQEPNKLPEDCAKLIKSHGTRYEVFLDACFPLLKGEKEKQEERLAEVLTSDDKEAAELRKLWKAFNDHASNQKGAGALTSLLGSNLHWPSHTLHKGKKSGEALSATAVSEFRRLLAAEDASVRFWIREQAGEFHPLDWIARTDSAKGARSRNHSVRYPSERAKNELYYCLSQSRAEFVPLVSVAYSAETWGDWVANAKRHGADYWRRKENSLFPGSQAPSVKKPGRR